MIRPGTGTGPLVSPTRQRWVLPLPPELDSPHRARDFLRRALTEGTADTHELDLVETVLLLASELVTNAALHGRSELVVELTLDLSVVHVAVADENSRMPQPQPEDLDALDGRGMALVDALAARHGVEPRPLGKAVWFELDR